MKPTERARLTVALRDQVATPPRHRMICGATGWARVRGSRWEEFP
jgi:hypothetical protein